MQNYDLIVVGSGMGGSLTAALNQNRKTLLLESDGNLGGCATTFKRFGHYFNAGATTLVGYETNHPLKNILDTINYTPNLIHSEVSIQIMQEGKRVDRTANLEAFLSQLQTIHPHNNNRTFWTKIYSLDQQFWAIKNLHFAKFSLGAYLRSLLSLSSLFKTFGVLLFMNAQDFIEKYLPNISPSYLDFIDAQLLITVQAKAKDINVLSLVLGLAYPFHKVYYPMGGMGSVFEGLLQNSEVHKKERVELIEPLSKGYRVKSNKATYTTEKLVLNSTAYDSSKLFNNQNIIDYYENFEFHDQSAFTLYLKVDSKEKFLHHYQIIHDEFLPNATSKSLFVSFSDSSDEKMSKHGYSVTISTHTKAYYWEKLNSGEYEVQKAKTAQRIIELFLDNFVTIKKEEIICSFAATSKSFSYYANRLNCGGSVLTLEKLFKMPTCTTPFKGLYNTGDTIFPGQGWPGVALGVEILNKEINAKL